MWKTVENLWMSVDKSLILCFFFDFTGVLREFPKRLQPDQRAVFHTVNRILPRAGEIG